MANKQQVRAKTDAALTKLLPPLETPDIFKKVHKGKKVANDQPQQAQPSKTTTETKSTKAPTDPFLSSLRHTISINGNKGPTDRAADKAQRPQRPTKNRNFRKSEVYKKGTGLSPTAKAVGLVTQAKEAVIKIDKASTGIKSAQHLMQAATYIARNGSYQLYDNQGNDLDYDAMKGLIRDWSSGDSPLADGAESKWAEARRLIVSCPKGSDAQQVLESAKQFAKEMLTENGYDFIMAIHHKDEAHPNEPDHPHVHILLKSTNKDGIRFSPRKDDLKFMRERFAAIAKQHGLNINATPRAVRGVSTKAKPIERYHHERRSIEQQKTADSTKAKQSQAQKWAIDRKKKQAAKSHPYRTSRDKEVIESLKTNTPIKDHEVLAKAKQTRQEILQNAAEAVSKLNNIDDDSAKILSKRLDKAMKDLPEVKSAQQQRAEAMRAFITAKQKQRKQAKQSGVEINKRENKKTGQSQAQKWAIERKKRSLDR